LDVNVHQMLEQRSASDARRMTRLIASIRVEVPADYANDLAHLARALTFDNTNPDSIVSAITVARENARQVREQISSEMWEQINRLYLHVRRGEADAEWRSEPQQFYKSVKEGAHLFQGITDATMSHDEGWHFIQIGRYLERASAISALLDAHFADPMAHDQADQSLNYLDWVAMLKSCTAFEAYCKVYTADIQPEKIAEFLLLNAESPRSVRFGIDAVQRALQVIARTTASRSAGRVERLAGRLRASLDYGQVDEIMDDMHGYLEQIQKQCAQIHTVINTVYVSYPADTAIER
jgi:uncharacterized alpha-E superfamily protein